MMRFADTSNDVQLQALLEDVLIPFCICVQTALFHRLPDHNHHHHHHQNKPVCIKPNANV